MSASLARRIRRIGVLRTTYTEKQTLIRITDEQGKEIAHMQTKRIPQRNFVEYETSEWLKLRDAIINKWRAARKARRATQKVG